MPKILNRLTGATVVWFSDTRVLVELVSKHLCWLGFSADELLLCPPRPRLNRVKSWAWHYSALPCELLALAQPWSPQIWPHEDSIFLLVEEWWWQRDHSSCLSIRLNKWNPNYPQLGPILTEGATASSDNWRWEVNYNEKRQKVPVFKHEYPFLHIYKEGSFDVNLVLPSKPLQLVWGETYSWSSLECPVWELGMGIVQRSHRVSMQLPVQTQMQLIVVKKVLEIHIKNENWFRDHTIKDHDHTQSKSYFWNDLGEFT